MTSAAATAPAGGSPQDKAFHCELRIQYPSARHAIIVHNAVSVDEEVRPDRVSRSFQVTDDCLNIRIEASQERFLRVAVSSVLETIKLSTLTMAEFDADSNDAQQEE